MALPTWDSDWEKPDPLRGGRGWSRHHFATVGVAVLLLVTAVSVLVPAVARARQKAHELHHVYGALRAQLHYAPEDPHGSR